jgi:8-oxo-dGTP pyrophosphatase MutT (NUDIX family)
MIRRKDSFGYIDFIRGKYSPYNIEQLQKSVDEMSVQEKSRILSEPFDKLWKQLWGENSGTQYRSEEIASSKKFELIKNGVVVEEKFITIKDIITNSKTKWTETEWEFPKGRRNSQEKDLDCAIREFEEETGFSQNDIIIIDNLLPFEEMYIGSNHKCYKHKYFLAYMNKSEDSMQNYQKTEVSKLEWKNIDECLESIRPYNLEKKVVISNINKLLQEYRIYS